MPESRQNLSDRCFVRGSLSVVALWLAACGASWAAAPVDQLSIDGYGEARQARAAARPVPTVRRYDMDYPEIGYSSVPTNNPVARLQQGLQDGEASLQFSGPRGYLDSVLTALGIDPSSQTLVYSKTSLQFEWIKAATPRAVYFNDDTYVAWVPGSNMLEVATMDSALGPVFYTLPNQKEAPAGFDRETLRCLTCHDKFSLSGGGVPLFTVLSSVVSVNGETLAPNSSIDVDDRTPFESRWGGWYVTGQHGEQVHLGNLQVASAAELKDLGSVRRGNLNTLEALFDTQPYLTDKSDIVALLVLEHQAYVQNLITRVNFKARTFVAKESTAGSWDEISSKTRTQLKKLMEPLVEAMLFVDAAPLASQTSGNAGFDRWFEAQGPRDAAGRSLRDLDLRTRLFKYPLSYLVYSDAFDGLPEYATSHIYTRLAEVLSGRDRSKAYSQLSTTDRQAIMEILAATKPAFARFGTQRQVVTSDANVAGSRM